VEQVEDRQPALVAPVWPTVGRDRSLDRALRALEPGGGAVALVGPAGVGKTHLARSVFAAAGRRGMQTEWVQATEATGAIPLGAFAPLLPHSSASTPIELLRSAVTELQTRARHRELLLVVDDAQLLDHASATLVQQVAALGDIHVVVTVRSGMPVPDAIVSIWKDDIGQRIDLDALGAADGLTRYVGGAVRDDLLGLAVSDVDLATRLRPEDVVERLQVAGIKAIPTGFDHGTVTAVSDGHVYEVTTLRRDVETHGRRATVAFTDDWREDAARRDFTINALMADPVSGEVFDYFGGLEDLKERHVRFIGNPLERIAEDHLRILRFFRFHARFGTGEMDKQALEACAARARDLMALSRERIADELLKLLAVDDPVPTVRIMLERAVLNPVIPEIEAGAAERLALLINAERGAALQPNPLRRLAALLPADPEIAGSIAARLKLSNKARKRIRCSAGPAPEMPRACAYRNGVECALDRLLLAGRASEALELADWPPPRLPISGGELIKRGLAEGPIVSKSLRNIEERWIESGFPEGTEFDEIVRDVLESALR